MPASLLLALALAAAPPSKLDEPLSAGRAPAPVSRAFDPKTKVDGATLQIILGQRALIRLDDKGLPVLMRVEEGRLAAAHPDGAVTETFKPPAEGEIAIALDGSAEKRATVLKVWNGAGKPLDYAAIALVMSRGQTLSAAAAPTCPVPPHSVRVETWNRPVAAVGVGRFRQPDKARACEQGD